MMQVAQEFSKYANLYGKRNIIQSEVAKYLLSKISNKSYKRIIDIGCGSGAVYQNLIDSSFLFEHFSAFDISSQMLALHPSSDQVVRLQGDFNTPNMFQNLPYGDYDLVISSSALQWSRDLDTTLNAISSLSQKFYFAIFTANTFHTIHKFANINSPIYSASQLKSKIDHYFDAEYETLHYKLHFDSVEKMLRYIKESGTSGGGRRMGYQQTKKLLEEYPLDYLEFEILFVSAKPI